MFRYMAFVWNAANRSQTEAAQLLAERLKSASPEWREVLGTAGLRVACAGSGQGASESYMLSDERGVVLGTVFERPSEFQDGVPVRKAVLDAPQTAKIVETDGRHLVRSFWGRYVAFVVDPQSNSLRVIRDPTGNLPCYRTNFRGVTVLFSCLEDCMSLQLLRFTVNWRYLRSRVAAGSFFAEETGLNEITEVYGGQCIYFQDERESKSFYWSPLNITRSNSIENPELAATLLRSTVQACVQAWASRYPQIIHRLSGGLDSSTVLGCLNGAAQRPKITCLTYFIPGGHADERPWARLAARHSECELVEHARNSRRSLTCIREIGPTVNPVVVSSYLETSDVERQLARDTNAGAVFTGDGGDSIFGRHSRDFAATDYIHRRGITIDLLKHAASVALLTDASAWKVLWEAVGSRFFDHRRDHRELIRIGRKLASEDILQETLQKGRFPHPWFNESETAPWYTVLQMGTLTQAPIFYDPKGDPEARDPELVSPLCSQPAVELCLSIPLYVHLHGGRDRGLARRAFAENVPREIIGRQWKDRAPRFFEEMLYWNRDFARELLLDGHLVQERLLDRAKLEGVLSGVPTKNSALPSELFDHLSVEAWLQRWTATEMRIAA